MIILLLGCVVAPPDRAAYTDGLRAPTYEEAWPLCTRVVDGEMRGDCQVSAAERFLRFEQCEEIDVRRWKDECRFVHSETLGRQGDLVGALDACKDSAYRGQCDDHVLGLLAVTGVDDDVATLTKRFDVLRPHLVGDRGAGQFWAHYFRNRVARGLVVDVQACPPGPCRMVAEREVGAAINEQQRRIGSAVFCAAPPPSPGWATTDVVRSWIRQQHERGCRQVESTPATE